MCLSLKMETLEELAESLLIINANVYYTSGVTTDYLSLYRFANK